jgi:hypothetical protein
MTIQQLCIVAVDFLRKPYETNLLLTSQLQFNTEPDGYVLVVVALFQKAMAARACLS